MPTVPSDARRPRSTVVQQVASVGVLILLPLIAYAVGLLLLSLHAEGDSRARFLREMTETQVHALDRRLESYAALLDFAAARVRDFRGRIPADCTLIFTRLAEAMDLVEGGGYAGPDGAYRCAAPEARMELSIAERPHFQEAAAGRRFVISTRVVSRVTGLPTVFIARRIDDDQGAFAGVVQFAVRPESLTEVLMPASQGPIQVQLVDRSGSPMASSPALPEAGGSGASRAAGAEGRSARIVGGERLSEARTIRFRDVEVDAWW